MLISHRSNLPPFVPPSEKRGKLLSRSIQKLLRPVPRPTPTAGVWKCGSSLGDSFDLNSFKPHVDELRESEEKALVWDCESTLYDSFELNSIKRQLDRIQESDEAEALVWKCGSTLYDSFELNSIKRQIDKIQASGHANTLVWDCGGPLYDSLELNSIKLHLYSATASRATSMPNLPNRRSTLPSFVPPSKKPSKLSRSIHKLLPSVFRRIHTSSPHSRGGDVRRDIFQQALEVDIEAYSPEISSLVRRTVSERLAASSIGFARASFSADRYFPVDEESSLTPLIQSKQLETLT